ncbi:MAG TPA: cation:proton antiporter [Gemmatimonadales bacterium]|nr:cation:proton antiporter [Gemmatimonadales bacterium]
MRPIRPERSIAILFALGVVMALLHRWTARGPIEGRATLAFGFLLLAALVAGDLAHRARLPRMTGYLLVGFAVGPSWLGLVRREELDALAFVEDAAVALIALAAGSQLTFAALARSRTALARLATGAIAFPFAAVTLVMVSVSPWFPLSVHHSLGDGIAVALVLGAWAAVSSPVVTVALLEELDVQGDAPRALLDVAIVQDVAVVILFALVLAAGKSLTSPGALNLVVAGIALAGVMGSLATGALSGFALSRCLRVVPRDPWPLVTATAFVAAAAARLLHLEPVIIGLAVGVAVENVAPREAEGLRPELKRAMPLLAAAFFVLAGAGLRLGVLADLWPWVLLLAGLRVVSLRYGMRWAGGAGRHSEVTPALARAGWLGLISQAGTALALGHLARRAFPEWGVSLEALIVAMIGAHLVAGPICLRTALARTGDITGRGGGSRDAEAAVEGGGGVGVASRSGL